MAKEFRLDAALIDGAELLARSLGHGAAWDGGLGHIVGRVVKASDVSKKPMSVEAARARLGLTDENLETARVIANLGRSLAGGRR